MTLKMHRFMLVTLTVTSLIGCASDDETASPSATVNETDNSFPVITMRGKPNIDVVYNAVFSDLGATATDASDGSLPVTVTGDVDTRVAGEYTITYSATNSAGNNSSLTRTVTVLADSVLNTTLNQPNPILAAAFDGQIVNADYWGNKPKVLSAAMGFADIVGINAPALTIDLVQQAGGAWNQDVDCGTDTRNYTATSLQQQVMQAYITQTPFGMLKEGALGLDGLPIVFSWPIDTSTVSLSDFQFILNTGDIVRPLAVSPFPNIENNERNTIVVFGEWGNRLPSHNPESRFPIKLEIVEDETPLLMIGPDAIPVSAVGLTWETASTPYDENNGPKLVGAKLNRIDGPMLGEGLNTPVPIVLPNDASVLYQEGNFLLRMLTSGGFSPDGQTGVRPDEFERYFRIHATGTNGNNVIIDRVDAEYTVRGGTLRVVGLADLGQPAGGGVMYDECYDEDLDNYIDIVLTGDDDAARSITFVEIPSAAGGYAPFYSPGGPSRTPFENTLYTQPGPSDLEPVILALDDPMRVTYSPGTQ